MFSQIIDQWQHKNKWYKFGSHTWCCKAHPSAHPRNSWAIECERTPFGNSARIAACHPPPPPQLSRFSTKIVFCLCVFQCSPIPFHRPTRLCCSDCKLLREMDLYNWVFNISEEHKSGVTEYFWAGWRLSSKYLQAAWNYLVFHQSSSKKMINTKSYPICRVRIFKWSQITKALKCIFLRKLAKTKVHFLDGLQFFLLSHFMNHLHIYAPMCQMRKYNIHKYSIWQSTRKTQLCGRWNVEEWEWKIW